MPLAISDNLKNSLSRPDPVYKKTIELYRQVWGGSSYAYDTATDITEYLTEDSAGTIMWKLDKEDYGVFNLDNVTLTFRNERNQWKQDNPKGLFPSGKLINQSKIIIKIGAQLVDGTYETLRSFTGYISGDPDYSPEEKTVSMTLVSAMSIFEKTSAEGISTAVTNEKHAYSAADVVAYNTAQNGVAAVGLTVKRGVTADGASAASEIKPTTGYSISNQNQTALPLTVTLVTALTATESLWITYKYWYQNKLLEWLAEQVMNLCGISSYSISPAVFSSNVENTWDFNSQADWDTCTKSNIDTITTPGSFKIGLLDNFGDGDYTANPAWIVKPKTSDNDFTISNGILTMVSSAQGNSFLKLNSTQTIGSWQFRAWPTAGVSNSSSVWIMAQTESTNLLPEEGYFVRCDRAYVQLYAWGATSDTLMISVAYTATASDVIRVSRSAVGAFELFINEVSRGTANNTTWTTSQGIYWRAKNDTDGVNTQYFDDFYFWLGGTTIGTGILTSPVKDASISVSSWGNLTAIYTGNGATVALETYTSDSSDFSTGNDAAGWVALSATGLILSAVKRYIKFRVTASLGSFFDPVLTPSFDQISVKYYTSATTIDLLNLSGMTCRQLLDLITEMPAYEMGFKADDTFIYRSRFTSVPPILDLRSETNIKTVRNLSDGIDRVKNRVIADFGIYQKVSDASADTEPNSITKYGTREYSVSASNLLPAANVNLAYAISPTILNYTKTPRRRCTVESKFILHLELGDKVRVYYDEPAAFRQWKWGDRDVVYGQADLEYFNAATPAARLNLWGVVMRVEGVSFDMMNWTTEFDLVEVI